MNADRAEGVRRGGPEDLDAIVGIETQAFEPSRRSSRRSLRRSLCSPFQRVYVFDVAGSAAGYLIAWPYRHTWRIYNLAADPGLRRRGVGGALLEVVAADARRHGATVLVLESRLDPVLVGYYEKRGFRAKRGLPDYYARGEDAVRMEMPLTGRH